ncbi:GTP-binding protein [Clostridium ihumii]|uniref:GTP-binding protein n=1 Tax=Clostridium ihumii TaxID=1470356 RepID=UPI00058F7CAE|nr:GTP-binding protein [Clostridium ihumii]
MTKIDLISGFLGAGKTTFIKKIIDEKDENERIIIIENEFGEVNIDSEILGETKVEIEEVTGGCICCTLIGNFKECIKNILEQYTPDRIIIEPSGVAMLSDILKIFNIKIENAYLNSIITIVDVENFDEYIDNFGEFYKDQIINSKTIVLSRVENILKENLNCVVERIKELNSKANIIASTLENILVKEILKIDENRFDDKKVDMNLSKPNFKPMKVMKKAKISADDTFESIIIKTSKVLKKEHIERIVKEINLDNNYGHILRIKGIVKSYNNELIQFDYVPNDLSMKNINATKYGDICIIGTELKKELLKKLF